MHSSFQDFVSMVMAAIDGVTINGAAKKYAPFNTEMFPTALSAARRGAEAITYVTHTPRSQNNNLRHEPVRAVGVVHHGVATNSSPDHSPMFLTPDRIQWPARLAEIALQRSQIPRGSLDERRALGAFERRALATLMWLQRMLPARMSEPVMDDNAIHLMSKQLIVRTNLGGEVVDVLVTPLASLPVRASIGRRAKAVREENTRLFAEATKRRRKGLPVDDLMGLVVQDRTARYSRYYSNYQNAGIPKSMPAAYLLHTPMLAHRRDDFSAAYGKHSVPRGETWKRFERLVKKDVLAAICGMRSLQSNRGITSNDRVRSKLELGVSSSALVLFGHLSRLRSLRDMERVDGGIEVLYRFLSGEEVCTDAWFGYVSATYFKGLADAIPKVKRIADDGDGEVMRPEVVLSDSELSWITSILKDAFDAYDWR